MKSVPRYLSRFFSPKYIQELDLSEIVQAFSSQELRNLWLAEVYEELRTLNLGVERALSKGDMAINDLSARRKAFGDVLEMILKVKNRKVNKDHDHKILSEIDLDRVTV